MSHTPLTDEELEQIEYGRRLRASSAAYREDVPRLLAEVRRLRAEVAGLLPSAQHWQKYALAVEARLRVAEKLAETVRLAMAALVRFSPELASIPLAAVLKEWDALKGGGR